MFSALIKTIFVSTMKFGQRNIIEVPVCYFKLTVNLRYLYQKIISKISVCLSVCFLRLVSGTSEPILIGVSLANWYYLRVNSTTVDLEKKMGYAKKKSLKQWKMFDSKLPTITAGYIMRRNINTNAKNWEDGCAILQSKVSDLYLSKPT